MTDDDVKLPEPDLIGGRCGPLSFDGYTKATVRALIEAAVAKEKAETAKLRGLLSEAYAFTTADCGLLPERIRAAIRNRSKA